jgi:hypothetical protein
MIELPREVGSEEKFESKKTVGELKEKTIRKAENDQRVVQQDKIQFNQLSLQVNHSSLQSNQLVVQFDNQQFNQEIRNTYLKRIGNSYKIKWLHTSDKSPEEIRYYNEQFNNYNQLCELRMNLYRNNFNVTEFFKTHNRIEIDDLPIQQGGDFPIKNFTERAKFIYYWKYFNNLIQDEFNEVPYEKQLPKEGEWKEKWKGYSGRQKILFMILWTLKKPVITRIEMLLRNKPQELKENERYWENIIRRANETKYDWKEFTQKEGRIMIEFWATRGYIREEDIQKDLDNVMTKIFRPARLVYRYGQWKVRTVRTICLETIDYFLEVSEDPDDYRERMKVEIGGRGSGLPNPVYGIARV